MHLELFSQMDFSFRITSDQHTKNFCSVSTMVDVFIDIVFPYNVLTCVTVLQQTNETYFSKFYRM